MSGRKLLDPTTYSRIVSICPAKVKRIICETELALVFSGVGNAMGPRGLWMAHSPSELCCLVGMEEEAFQAFALLGEVNHSVRRSGAGWLYRLWWGRTGFLRRDRVMCRTLHISLYMHTVCSFTELSGMNKILPVPGVCTTENADTVRCGECLNNIKSCKTCCKGVKTV